LTNRENLSYLKYSEQRKEHSMHAILTTEVRFTRKHYKPGTQVEVLSKLVHDGVFLARFPNGEETWLAAWRVINAPPR
jgi:hypothetical protein